MKTKRNYKKRYFIKPDNDTNVSEVKDDFFSNLTKEEALYYGLHTALEIKRTLKEDAILGDEAYIGNMKVTTGLDRFLKKINEIYPDILKEINQISIKVDGQIIFKC